MVGPSARSGLLSPVCSSMNAITYATAQLLRVLPRTAITRMMGRLADFEWPDRVGRTVVDLYCRAYDVDLAECEKVSGFTSFDEFFTRELRVGARPLPDDPAVIVSPADGRVGSCGPVGGRGLLVKGRPGLVDVVVGGAEDARRHAGGEGCVVYLSSRRYPRVHAPVRGTVSMVR